MKLSWLLFNKICDPKNKFTSKEIDTILYLSQKQDDFGVVAVVHWKEFTKNTSVKTQSFYNSLFSLKKRGVIEEIDTPLLDGTKNDYGYRNIRIIDNNFMSAEGKVTKESIKAAGGYFDLDKYPILNTEAFYRLTPSEKRVVLYMLKQHNYYIQNNIREDIITTLCSIQRITQKQRRSARKFVYAIAGSGLLPVKVTSECDLIWESYDVRAFYISQPTPSIDSKADRRNERIISTLLAKRGIEADRGAIKEALKVLGKQYSVKASLTVQWIVSNCIKVRKSICPKYINARCREILSDEAATYEQICSVHSKRGSLSPA